MMFDAREVDLPKDLVDEADLHRQAEALHLGLEVVAAALGDNRRTAAAEILEYLAARAATFSTMASAAADALKQGNETAAPAPIASLLGRLRADGEEGRRWRSGGKDLMAGNRIALAPGVRIDAKNARNIANRDIADELGRQASGSSRCGPLSSARREAGKAPAASGRRLAKILAAGRLPPAMSRGSGCRARSRAARLGARRPMWA